MSNTWMVEELDLVAKSLSESAKKEIEAPDFDFPVGWEIEEWDGEFIFHTTAAMFPGLFEPMEKQLCILQAHGARGSIRLYDIDGLCHDRWTLTDEGIKYQKGKITFEEDPEES